MEKAEKIEIRKNIQHNEIQTDKSRMSVIISNLVANSIKYSGENKKQKWVEIASYQQNGSSFIEIRDNGIGITKEHHKDIYNMFYRAHEKSQGLVWDCILSRRWLKN